MSADTVKRARSWHKQFGAACAYCGLEWPCDAVRAADALQEAREALRFYAERDNWIARNPPGGRGAPAWHDMGERAAAALDSGHQEDGE